MPWSAQIFSTLSADHYRSQRQIGPFLVRATFPMATTLLRQSLCKSPLDGGTYARIESWTSARDVQDGPKA